MFEVTVINLLITKIARMTTFIFKDYFYKLLIP